MRVNSDLSIEKALVAHERFGSWQAVRKAASARTERREVNGSARPHLSADTKNTRKG